MRGRHGDEGAVAIMVALVTVVLVGISAFAVDIGQAYVSKRNLQNASDAAALAGAGVLGKYSGACAVVAGNTTATSDAQNVADGYRDSNRPGSTRDAWNVGCTSDKKGVQVQYGSEASTTTVFANIFGDKSITASRSATAMVDVPPDATGLRPYAICANDLPRLLTHVATPIDFPDCDRMPGQWYTLLCPELKNANNTVLASETANGCSSDISIIDTSSDGGDPAAIRSTLIDACSSGTPSAKPGCLQDDSGNDMTSAPVASAWSDLVTSGKTILLPVFYPGTIKKYTGQDIYPVYAFIGVRVCGYQWQSSGPTASLFSSDLECAPTAPIPGKSDYVWFLLKSIQTSGSTNPSTCAVGDPTCDFGTRRVLLTQ